MGSLPGDPSYPAHVVAVEPDSSVAAPDARQQAAVDARESTSEREPSTEPERFRVLVRLKTSTDELLDEQFEGDSWRGGYVSQITVVPTSEPLTHGVSLSTLRLASLSCGTYTKSWAVPNTSFSGMVVHGVSGTLDLVHAPPAYANAMLRGNLLASARIEPGMSEVTLILPTDRALGSLGGVALRLVDARSGQPIERAGISLADQAKGTWSNPYQMPLEGGRFERERLPPGDYELQVRLPGYEHLHRSFLVQAGRTTDLGDIPIREGGAVRGRVVDEQGNGLGVPLAWSLLNSPNGPAFLVMQDSNGDGHFALAELPTDGVLLQVQDPDWALDPSVLHLAPGVSTENFELVARRGVPVTLKAQSEVDAEFTLVVRRSDGIAIWRSSGIGSSSDELRLVPGDYRVELSSPGRPATVRQFLVTEDPTTVDVGP